MIQRLFVYGTLAPGRQNQHLLAEVDGTWQDATVIGTLHPQGWGATMGYPAIILGENDGSGKAVKGFLFSSEKLPDLWAMLDEFEGEAYQRVSTVVRLTDGSSVDAYVYELRSKGSVSLKKSGSSPSQE